MKSFFYIGAVSLMLILSETNGQLAPLVEKTEYAGKCNWCIMTNSTWVYCSPQNKCYNRAPSGSAPCSTSFTDMLASPTCATDVCGDTIPL